MTGGGIDLDLDTSSPASEAVQGKLGHVHEGGAPHSSSPLISIPWSNMEMSVSLLNTVSTQTYQVFPQLDDRLPSRKSLRTMKKLLALKQQQQHQQQQQLRQKQTQPPAKSNGTTIKAHVSPGLPKAAPRHAAATTPNETDLGSLGASAGPMKCHICGKSFSKATYLKRHIQSHSTVKPHKCDICGWGETFFAFPFILDL